MNKKEEFIRKTILSDVDDVLREEIISFINNNFYDQTSKKYIVWIAKEQKKFLKESMDGAVFDRKSHPTLEAYNCIIDWASQNNIDLFKLNFSNANSEQKKWHKQLARAKKKEHHHDLDKSRIIYRFDSNYFIYLLTEKELEAEGNEMGHCVGGYKNKVRNKECVILSLRDSKNKSHVTIELLNNGCFNQIQGKENKQPIKKYKNLIIEFLEWVKNQ